LQLKPAKTAYFVHAVANIVKTDSQSMATLAAAELRRLRTAGIDDPGRVVEIGRNIVGKGGFGSAGDECNHHSSYTLISTDFLILDQVAVAGLITGDDALAKVFFLNIQRLL
jgi:hypothetical protein